MLKKRSLKDFLGNGHLSMPEGDPQRYIVMTWWNTGSKREYCNYDQVIDVISDRCTRSFDESFGLSIYDLKTESEVEWEEMIDIKDLDNPY